MLNKIKLLAVIMLLSVVVGGVLKPQVATAELFNSSKSQACEALNTSNGTPAAAGNCGKNSDKRVNDIISSVINIFSFIIGVVAVFMIIISGLKYITAQGDSAGLSSAKNTLLYAIIGLVVVASAQIIVKFVIHRTDTGVGGQPTSETSD